MTGGPHRLALSVDVEDWYHSGRWVDGEQSRAVPDTDARRRALGAGPAAGAGLVPLTRALLELFARRAVRATFFVLGEAAELHPELVGEIAARGHEIACHGLRHVDMTVLGPRRFASELEASAERLRALTGRRPLGYRAPNLVYEPWATRILEEHGFAYDSSVCPSRPMGGKYRGWAKAPSHPYRPSYEDVAELGGARLVELPLPAFPVLKLAAGSGISTRILGLPWTRIALASALRRGHTGYYLHPWEIGPRPPRGGSRLKRAIFQRRTGPWMLRALESLIEAFAGSFATAREAAASCTSPGWAYQVSAAALAASPA